MDREILKAMEKCKIQHRDAKKFYELTLTQPLTFADIGLVK